ncbi:MAG: 2TM domain-containing protein [Burkholderiaceae bacterium]
MICHDAALDPIERQALRRARMRYGLYIHAFVYVAVNLGLFLLDTTTGGPRWSGYPMLGWGLGLAIHAAVVTLSLSGKGLMESLVEQERRRLRERGSAGGGGAQR